MKKIAPGVIFLSLLSVAYLKLHVPLFPGQNQADYRQMVIQNPIGVAVRAQEPLPEIPRRIIIPQIGLESSISPVSLTSEKIVDTPVNEVGWYEKSARPGQTGTIALNGHYTDSDMTPGVFNKLSLISPDAEIKIIDAQNTTHIYRVTSIETVGADNFPLEKVYGNSQTAALTLVTCAGEYDANKEDYSNRTIVYAGLVTP